MGQTLNDRYAVLFASSCLPHGSNIYGPIKNFCATTGDAHISGLTRTRSCNKMHVQHVSARRLHLHKCVTLATPLMKCILLPMHSEHGKKRQHSSGRHLDWASETNAP